MQARAVPNGGQFDIAITLGAQGAARMAAATAAHAGRPMAIVVNGVVVLAPTVRGPVNDQVLITGDFTREEAERIVGVLQR